MNVRLLKKRRDPPAHPLWRLTRIVVGTLVVLLGLIMLVTPGPGIVVILAGVWLMSADVRIARRAMMKLRIVARRARRKVAGLRARSNA